MNFSSFLPDRPEAMASVSASIAFGSGIDDHRSGTTWGLVGRTPIILIADGSSIHTARAVRDFVARTGGRLRLFFLPAYAPDLNPDEWVNQNVKARAAREAVADEHELAAAMHSSLRRLQKCPGIVRAFFADPHLSYTRP
ncbi:transposase [Planomonospora sp. ID82291]|uniref:transposase n=1 Tax=Planomonospora sp. ID82291 TaxID=2738136 RepID=UPI0018C398B4|nr:transposase [Planomonospora sp. ID82291]MBG0815648.1 transposase [Planomonospora sp. ID82291]